jgi:hypothetical protein
MARKRKELERREGWYHVKEGAGKGRRYVEWDVTLDLQYGGMEFDQLREELARIEQEHGDEFEKFSLEVEMEADPYEDREWPRCYVRGWRKENDAEYQARLDEDAQRKARQEAWERQQYEALKKKFDE